MFEGGRGAVAVSVANEIMNAEFWALRPVRDTHTYMPCSGCGSDEAAEDAGCCSKCLSGTRSCCGRFWGGWVDFIFQSNIIELAIGVAVGIAFEELIASFTDSFVKPGAGRMKDGHDRPSRSRGCPVATLSSPLPPWQP